MLFSRLPRPDPRQLSRSIFSSHSRSLPPTLRQDHLLFNLTTDGRGGATDGRTAVAGLKFLPSTVLPASGQFYLPPPAAAAFPGRERGLRAASFPSNSRQARPNALHLRGFVSSPLSPHPFQAGPSPARCFSPTARPSYPREGEGEKRKGAAYYSLGVCKKKKRTGLPGLARREPTSGSSDRPRGAALFIIIIIIYLHREKRALRTQRRQRRQPRSPGRSREGLLSKQQENDDSAT